MHYHIVNDRIVYSCNQASSQTYYIPYYLHATPREVNKLF